jgi:peptide/nickel transport system substrate-binding protein
MSCIVYPFPAVSKTRPAGAMLLALCVLVAAPDGKASTRPKAGGTLRAQMGSRAANIDPRQIPSDSVAASALERMDTLLFDRLVRIDERGTLQPALAVSWEHDATAKRWQFKLREGVKFSDGTPMKPAVVAMALQQLLGVSYEVSATSDSVVIQADHPLPNLATELSSGRYFIFRVTDDNSLVGTGPFRLAEWSASGSPAKAVLTANESCWSGRPFVDKIELLMGVDSQQQANAISFGQADLVDLPASEVRRAAQRGLRTASSDPVELFALAIDNARPAVQNAQLRQAISISIDRVSIADVILQKQGAAAGGLLPNWISGYAHLFPPTFDLARARDLLTASAREVSHPAPLSLVYDSSDAEARAVADRVAVNLREVGIMVQISGQSPDRASGGKTKSPAADLRLVRQRIATPDPALALSELLHSFGESVPNLETLEDVYNAERAPIEAFRVIPLVHVTESYGLSPQVRDWMAPRWGGWDLADVWLGPPSGSNTGGAPGGNAP